MTHQRYFLLGAIVLAATMTGHSINLLVIEPQMGFRELSDFFDIDKVLAASGSAAWYIGNVLHVLAGLGMLFIYSGFGAAAKPEPVLAKSFALAAAPLFVVVGLSGFVLDTLPELLPDPSARNAAIYGLLATRTALLGGAVALFGFLIAALSLERHVVAGWLRILGIPVSIAAIVFMLVPTPIPALLAIWSVGLAVDRMAHSNTQMH